MHDNKISKRSFIRGDKNLREERNKVQKSIIVIIIEPCLWSELSKTECEV